MDWLYTAGDIVDWFSYVVTKPVVATTQIGLVKTNCSTDRRDHGVYYVRPPKNGIASYAYALYYDSA